jgi:hypothetical protein
MNKNGTTAHQAIVFFTILVAMLALGVGAAAQTETVIHNFSGTGNDGSDPQNGRLLALNGKFYGVTGFGGANGAGVVYAIQLQSDGTWRGTTLYSFTGGNDGNFPLGSLIADPAGNLYGVTALGGVQGGGTAYKLTRTATGTWQFTLLWSFGASGDAANPFAGLAMDKSGKLFGTSSDGGLYSSGTVFELSPSATGAWSEKVLYSFGAASSDGANPYAALTIDSSGNLYGTTLGGGSASCDPFTLGCGIVFELSRTSGGWTETILHLFQADGTDGFYTQSPLVMDKAGNLYGTTQYGGSRGQCVVGFSTQGCGTVFELSPSSSGWTEQILYDFPGGSGGSLPDSGLLLDHAGNLFGEMASSSTSNGAVYRLVRTTSGKWSSRILVNFNGTDGNNPQGGLIFDGSNSLLGTTITGGTGGHGVVFQLTQ